MKKPTLQQRLRYKFDNLMSKGTMFSDHDDLIVVAV